MLDPEIEGRVEMVFLTENSGTDAAKTSPQVVWTDLDLRRLYERIEELEYENKIMREALRLSYKRIEQVRGVYYGEVLKVMKYK